MFLGDPGPPNFKPPRGTVWGPIWVFRGNSLKGTPPSLKPVSPPVRFWGGFPSYRFFKGVTQFYRGPLNLLRLPPRYGKGFYGGTLNVTGFFFKGETGFLPQRV